MNRDRAVKVINNIQEVNGFDERLGRVKDFIILQQEEIETMRKWSARNATPAGDVTITRKKESTIGTRRRRITSN